MSDNNHNLALGAMIPRVVRCCVLLTTAIVLIFPLFAWMNYSSHGRIGVTSAAVGAGVAWFGATIALVLAGVMHGPQNGAQGVLLGMLFRMGIPMGAAILFTSSGGPLAEASVFEMILFFYLVTLVIETPMSVHLVRFGEKISKAASDGVG